MNKLQTVLDTLEKIACLGNGDKHGNSVGNVLAIEAIAIVKEMMQSEPVAELGVSTFTWLADRPPAGTKLYTHAAPQAVPAEPSCPDCNAPHLLYECVHCSASNYPAAPAVKETK